MTYRTPLNCEAIAKDVASKLGFQLSDEGVQGLVAQLMEFAKVEPGSPIVVGDLPVTDFIANALAAAPSWATAPKAKTPTAPDMTGLNRTQRALATTQAARTGATELKAKAAAELFQAHGNPWRSSSLNRTRQALIRSGDPVLADKLQGEASL